MTKTPIGIDRPAMIVASIIESAKCHIAIPSHAKIITPTVNQAFLVNFECLRVFVLSVSIGILIVSAPTSVWMGLLL